MKNVAIIVLLIALATSGYFNYRNSKKFKVEPGKDVLKISLYGVDTSEYRIAKANGIQIQPKLITSFDLKTIPFKESLIGGKGINIPQFDAGSTRVIVIPPKPPIQPYIRPLQTFIEGVIEISH